MGFLEQGFVAQMDGQQDVNNFVRSRKKSKDARAKQHAPESFFAGGDEARARARATWALGQPMPG
jgi:hypothetical protein